VMVKEKKKCRGLGWLSEEAAGGVESATEM
jgi:hypothetical protein